MITLAEVEKLSHVHAVEPVVLSVYLTVPRSAVELPVRVDELATAAVRTAGRSGRLREEDRWSARIEAALAGRGRPGQRLAVFACAEIGLLEVVTLPEAGPAAWPDRGVLGVRPHIRPLLAALQPSQRSVGAIPAQPAGELRVAGLAACLAAVNASAAGTLVVPCDGLIPGYECGRCGALGLTADCCPDWGTAALPVPDVIEEMISRTLEDGGRVRVVHGALEGFGHFDDEHGQVRQPVPRRGTKDPPDQDVRHRESAAAPGILAMPAGERGSHTAEMTGVVGPLVLGPPGRLRGRPAIAGWRPQAPDPGNAGEGKSPAGPIAPGGWQARTAAVQADRTWRSRRAARASRTTA